MISTNGLRATSRLGLALAAAILLGWLISLVALLRLNVAASPGWLVLLAVMLRTFLQTGLFITAHDAMHGVLVSERRGMNRALGALFLGLYAALPYPACLRNHHLHHQRQATSEDPDFHGDPTAGPVRWYLRFMAGYLNPIQMTALLSAWGLLVLMMSPWNGNAWLNLLLFCTLPLLLSSLQLFLFGTYLPHRGQRLKAEPGGAISLDHPAWLSLLTCFHFGYHREHHDHPQLAWFQLPALRRRINSLASELTT